MMKYSFLLTFFLLTFSSTLNAQMTPCEAGMAGEFPCDGYDLIAHFDIAQLQGGSSVNDIWGWTHPDTGAEYALVGVFNGTAIVDLSIPESPVLIGNLPTHTFNSSWRDIKVYENHAYIVSEAANHGMQVFDLMQLSSVTNPPVVFSETAHFDQFGDSHNVVINEETGFAYVVGASTFSGGLVFINIQDPANPTAAGGYEDDGYTHDAQVVHYQGPDSDYMGLEIGFASNENTLTIVNVDAKANPSLISRTGYEDVRYAHQGWLSEDHRYFFSNDELDELQGEQINTRTIIWDCIDLDAPVVIGEFIGSTEAIDHNIYVKGNLLYQANYTAGMRVLDISDVANANLEEVGYFDVYPDNNSTSFHGSWSVYPYFESGLIIISSIEGGLFVVRASESDPLADCPADIDGDGQVGISDFLSLNSLFGTDCDSCPEDINGDGSIDIEDFLEFNSAYGTTCSGVTNDGSK